MKHLILTLAFCLITVTASAHVGGLDSYGGHRNRSLNLYECHKCPEPLTGKTFSSKAAMLAELNAPPPEPPPVVECPTCPVCQEIIASDWEFRKVSDGPPVVIYDMYLKGVKIGGQARGWKYTDAMYVLGIEPVETWYRHTPANAEWPWVKVP